MSRRQERQSKKIHPGELKGLSMRQSFLIFCEGPTEGGYFSSFKIKTKVLRGGNALKIIEEAIIQKEKETKKVDQYWAVFDKDETPSKDFDQAIKLALSKNIKVAWSNQAFELWIILHYQELFSSCDRRRYKEILCKYIKGYSASEKGEEQGRRLHAQTSHLVQKAIDRAIKGHSLFEEKSLPSGRESSTTVFELVNAILKNQ